jgi:EAL domain-containing protein (putative c-di-GMP-specific phosphodiesterase class I)
MVAGIRERIREGRRRITASAGLAASTPELHISSAELLMAADIALYQAKDAGRDRCAVATGVERGHTWIDEIRAALADDRLVLYAQPIIDLRTGATVREELLVRMIDAHGDLVQPASFIPASERFGLINEIDRWVVAHGLELALTGRRLEINLSAHSLGDSEITRMVAAAIERGLDPATVVFEITETAAAANYAEAADFAVRLGQLGCGFALDDFGTGFGSLSYLKHVPIGYLKIDTEFVRELATEPASQNIVRAVVTIAAQLGQQTIAEGVEEAATLDLLRELGVDHGQGFHIARPGPATSAPPAGATPTPA